MEELTIKELAPYLPYGLKLWHKEYKAKHILDISIKEGVQEREMSSVTLMAMVNGNTYLTPLLRPLSQLTEEIEHNSISVQLEPNLEKITPSKFIYKHWFYTIREDGHYSYHIGDGTVIGGLYSGVPYSLIELLLEWHFDVFGLIGRGLALPIDGKEVEGE